MVSTHHLPVIDRILTSEALDMQYSRANVWKSKSKSKSWHIFLYLDVASSSLFTAYYVNTLKAFLLENTHSL